MRILITGGAGFIGSQLGLYLDSKKHDVILLDDLSYGYIHNFIENKNLLENFICLDIRSPKLEQVLKEVDVVFHIAGYVSLPGCNDNPYEAYSINVAGTANVLEMSRRNGVKKVVFASTAALYEKETDLPFREDLSANPILLYAQTKKTAENICQSFREMFGMDITILRFFNVYGPHMDYRPPSYLISYLIGCLLKKEKPILHSNGKQSRDFVYVTDVARLCEVVMTHPKAKNEVFNVGSGQIISVQGIFDILAELLGETKIQPTYRDPKLIWEKFPRQFEGRYPFKAELLNNEVNKLTQASIEKAHRLLGWKPRVSLRQGLKKTVDYVLKKGYGKKISA
jgi:nucleoside-diphosphate-sugar epimerase